jgi:hypothetical protein
MQQERSIGFVNRQDQQVVEWDVLPLEET